MADFTGTVLTQKGRNLLSKAQTGATLQFTKIKIGDGIWATNTDPTQLNDLVSPKLSLPIQAIQVVGDGTIRLRFVLTNSGLSQGFFMREIGIYAQDPDLGEILYAVAYASDRADFIPSDGVTKVENVVDIYTVIANSQNVTAVISDTVVIATKQDVDNLNTQLTTQINIAKPELGTSAPTNVYAGKLWLNTNTNFLEYYDGSNWKNVIVANSDKIDGFDASLTPSPNVIVPLNSQGILDLSGTSAKINTYTIRRINGNSLTSDYPLAVGEEAFYSWDTTASTSLNLHISTSGGIYQIIINGQYNTSADIGMGLYPNNTSYSNAFTLSYYWVIDNSNTVYGYAGTNSYFPFGYLGSGGLANILCSTYTDRKFMISEERITYKDDGGGRTMTVSHRWSDTSTAWSSLGTLKVDSANGVIYVLVRRLA